MKPEELLEPRDGHTLLSRELPWDEVDLRFFEPKKQGEQESCSVPSPRSAER